MAIAARMFEQKISLFFLGTNVAAAASIIPYFFVGAAIRVVNVKLALRLDVSLGLVFLLLIVEARFPEQLPIALWFCLPYIIVSFGLASTPGLRNAALFGDLSYGLYLYAFPVSRLLHELVRRAALDFMLTSRCPHSALCASHSYRGT